jgi:bis(5'-nucleosidyl)-tetraphosphatase
MTPRGKFPVYTIPAGAGIVVVRDFGNGYEVLALTKHNGKLDIPKGAIDDGEFPLEAALRETEEESGITNLSFKWGFAHTVNGKLTCYVAVTDQDPTIRKNPHSGIIEHTEANWVSWDYILANTDQYLVSCIEWARSTIGSIKA